MPEWEFCEDFEPNIPDKCKRCYWFNSLKLECCRAKCNYLEDMSLLKEVDEEDYKLRLNLGWIREVENYERDE